MLKKYLGYILPSMLSFLLTGVYSIIDGIFVGRALGDPGLAAINIVWPLAALILSTGTGIGLGSSVMVSLNRGAGKEEEALRAEGNAFFLLFVSAIFLTVLLFCLGTPLLLLLGADAQTLPGAREYLFCILLGSGVQIFACGLVPLMRNHGASFYAMWAMASGCVSNIILDYVFVQLLDLGLKGAAGATVLGQVFTLIFCLVFYAQKKNRIPIKYIRPAKNTIRSVLKVSASPFGLTYLPSVTIILMNLQSMRYGGPQAVSAYAVLAYIISFMELLVQGIGDGSQPLFSASQGCGDQKVLKKYSRWTFMLAIGFGLAGGIIFYLLRNILPGFYGTSRQAASYIVGASPGFALVMVLYGLTKPAVSYFYATHKILRSTFLVYGEIFLTAFFITLLPALWGLTGIWRTIPAVQLVLGLFSIIFLLIKDSSQKDSKNKKRNQKKKIKTRKLS